MGGGEGREKALGASCYRAMILKMQFVVMLCFVDFLTSAKGLFGGPSFEENLEFLILNLTSILSWKSYQYTWNWEGQIQNSIAVTGNFFSDFRGAKISLSIGSCLQSTAMLYTFWPQHYPANFYLGFIPFFMLFFQTEFRKVGERRVIKYTGGSEMWGLLFTTVSYICGWNLS